MAIFLSVRQKHFQSEVRCQFLILTIFPACVVRSISNDEEVNYPRGEIQSYMCFTVDHCDAVSVSIAGSRHPTTEQQERGPTCEQTHIQVTFGLLKD